MKLPLLALSCLALVSCSGSMHINSKPVKNSEFKVRSDCSVYTEGSSDVPVSAILVQCPDGFTFSLPLGTIAK